MALLIETEPASHGGLVDFISAEEYLLWERRLHTADRGAGAEVRNFFFFSSYGR